MLCCRVVLRGSAARIVSMLSTTAVRAAFFLTIFFRLRSNGGVATSRKEEAMLGSLAALGGLLPLPLQLSQHLPGIPDTTFLVCLLSLGDVFLHFRILQLQIIFQLVGIHDAGN